MKQASCSVLIGVCAALAAIAEASSDRTGPAADRPMFAGWPPEGAEYALKQTWAGVTRNACVMRAGPRAEFHFAPDGDGTLLFSSSALRSAAEDPLPAGVSIVDGEGTVYCQQDQTLAVNKWTDVTAVLKNVAGRRLTVTVEAAGLDEANRIILSEPEWIPARRSAAKPSVILISLDTLRADRLCGYGYRRATSPHLDRFARDHGVVFRHAFANAPWTVPSHVSMLTAWLPSFHGVNQDFHEYRAWAANQNPRFRVLPDQIKTLPELLRQAGYLTGAFANLHPEIGFARGFASFVRREAVTEQLSLVSEWISLRKDAPFFLFLHTYEVHAPYRRAEFLTEYLDGSVVDELTPTLVGEKDYRAFLKFLRRNGLYRPELCSAMYDGGVAYADRCLGRLFAFLEKEGLLADTMIVVTSDHGEEFADHDPKKFYGNHGHTTYQEQLHVPLVIHYPRDRWAGTKVTANVSLLDIVPTVLAEVGIKPESALQGLTLHGLSDGTLSASAERSIISECTADGDEWKAVIQGRYKYVAVLEKAHDSRVTPLHNLLEEMLFDLQSDPGEKTNLAESLPAVTDRLRAELEQVLEQAGTTFVDNPTTELSPETLQRLKALGYVR